MSVPTNHVKRIYNNIVMLSFTNKFIITDYLPNRTIEEITQVEDKRKRINIINFF